MYIFRPFRLLSFDSPCSICSITCGVPEHKNMSSAKRRLLRYSPSIFTLLFAQFNFLKMLCNVAVNSYGDIVSPCRTPLLTLIFSLSVCAWAVSELSVPMYTSSIPCSCMSFRCCRWFYCIIAPSYCSLLKKTNPFAWRRRQRNRTEKSSWREAVDCAVAVTRGHWASDRICATPVLPGTLSAEVAVSGTPARLRCSGAAAFTTVGRSVSKTLMYMIMIII